MSKSPQKKRCDKCNRNLKIASFSSDPDNCNSCIARQERQDAYLASVLEKLPFCHDENWKRYTHSYPHFLALLELRKYLASQGSIAAVARVLKVNAGTIHKAIFNKYVSPKLYYRLGISEDLEIDDLIDENLHLSRNYEYYRDAARDLAITVQILEGENDDWKPAPVCPECNEVHLVGWCVKVDGPPIKPKPTYNRKRQQIRLAASVSKEERELLREMAAEYGLSWSEYCQELAAQFIEDRNGLYLERNNQ